MKQISRRAFGAQLAAAGLVASAPAQANFGAGNNTVLYWNQALTDAIAATATQATIAARACSMLHEAIYNAWAAYHPSASFTVTGLYKRPFWEWADWTKTIAICHAAALVLTDLFPSRKPVFSKLLADLVPDLQAVTPWGWAAAGIGRDAGNMLLGARYWDGANQRGDLAPGAYSDWTGYAPVNTPDALIDPNRWQPLRVVNAEGATVVQKYLTPHWGRVRPFALASGSALRPVMDHLAPTRAEMDQLIAFSAALDDNSKSLVDIWAANPGTVSPPGQWMQIAETVSARDNNCLDEDVKLFFATGQAVLDASIAAWDAKRAYDSVRPISAIRLYYRNQTIRSWAGPGQGVQAILGQHWRPFQRPATITPPFPDFVSGHSTFSASAARVIAGLRGSDLITLSLTQAARSIKVDPGTPAADVTYTWHALSEAADAAGLSRRIGGIHFEQADLKGRQLGRQVGDQVLARCQRLFAGR